MICEKILIGIKKIHIFTPQIITIEPYFMRNNVCVLWKTRNFQRTCRVSMFIKNYILLFIILCCVFSACHKHETVTTRDNAYLDSLVNTNVSDDSLLVFLERFSNESNPYGLLRVYREMGKRGQNRSDFSYSLELCKKTLEIAEELSDTMEIMNSLNNIGTNFRRMGLMGEASSIFYRTFSIFEEYSNNTNIQAKKSHLIALNSIGNINRTLGNHDTADSLFHVALTGALEIEDIVGAAINTANIGLIFQDRGQYDSAWVYLRRSMDYNIQADYKAGIEITHVNYGKLYELQGDLDNALREFQFVIDDTQTSSRWQWLMSYISYARLQIRKGNLDIAKPYLEKSEEMAKDIRSLTHLSEASRLCYMYYEKTGNYSKALDYHVKHKMYADSLRRNESNEQMHNLREQYAIQQSQKELLAVTNNYKIKQQSKNRLLIICGLALLLSVSALAFLGYALKIRARSHHVMKNMEKIRSDFFTNITHEFRTPLTVILGLSKQLQLGKMNKDETYNSLTTIVRQGNNLLSLVNQLLDISKIQSVIGRPEWYSGDIIVHIEMIVETYRIYAKQKQIDLSFSYYEKSIEMDFAPDYLRKILHNMLSNALKYTPTGGRIQILAIKEKDSLILKVNDTGIGIHADDLPFIFDAFYQTSSTSMDAGSGIGLALVSQIIKRMNGSITVQSDENKGTEFTVTLPLKQGKDIFEKWILDNESETEPYQLEENQLLPIPQDEHSNDNNKPMVLIVEDNTDVSHYIGSLLKDNYNLIYASNGNDGIEKATEYIPDLIVTDLMMPEMDGYALCKEVRKSIIVNHIPIIIISAKAEESDRVLGLDCGADAYMQKPFNPNELQVRIVRLLKQRQLLREKFSQILKTGVKQNLELTPSCDQFINQLNEIINGQINDNDLNSSYIADKLFLSRSQLNRKVLSITGLNTASYILSFRMNKAKHLLASSSIPISDVAIECGFNDSAHFSRVFRQKIGLSPTSYRTNPQQVELKIG